MTYKVMQGTDRCHAKPWKCIFLQHRNRQSHTQEV